MDAVPANFTVDADTMMSPRRVLRENRAHCMEGALLAACVFALQGRRPLLLDLVSAKGDDDHVIALFQEHGRWGAVTKTNHAVLRYREPVYRHLTSSPCRTFMSTSFRRRAQDTAVVLAPRGSFAVQPSRVDGG